MKNTRTVLYETWQIKSQTDIAMIIRYECNRCSHIILGISLGALTSEEIPTTVRVFLPSPREYLYIIAGNLASRFVCDNWASAVQASSARRVRMPLANEQYIINIIGAHDQHWLWSIWPNVNVLFYALGRTIYARGVATMIVILSATAGDFRKLVGQSLVFGLLFVMEGDIQSIRFFRSRRCRWPQKRCRGSY